MRFSFISFGFARLLCKLKRARFLFIDVIAKQTAQNVKPLQKGSVTVKFNWGDSNVAAGITITRAGLVIENL